MIDRAAVRRQRGFTLLELVVTVSIIAILAAIVVPMLNGVLSGSQVTRTASDVKTVVGALRQYYKDVGGFPPAVAAGADPGLSTNVSGSAYWRGPYLERWPNGNAWGAAVTWSYDRAGSGGYTGADFNYDGTANNESRLSLCNFTPNDVGTLTQIDQAYDDGVIAAPAAGARSTSGAMYWDGAAGCLRIYVGEGGAR